MTKAAKAARDSKRKIEAHRTLRSVVVFHGKDRGLVGLYHTKQEADEVADKSTPTASSCRPSMPGVARIRIGTRRRKVRTCTSLPGAWCKSHHAPPPNHGIEINAQALNLARVLPPPIVRCHWLPSWWPARRFPQASRQAAVEAGAHARGRR